MYWPPDPKAWIGKLDPEGGTVALRWHQQIKLCTLEALSTTSAGIAVLGLASDEGTVRTGGQAGVREGPQAIRSALADMLWKFPATLDAYDVGNIVDEKGNMEKALALVQESTNDILEAGFFPVLLGGGSELLSPHFGGVATKFPRKKVGVVVVSGRIPLSKPSMEFHAGSSLFHIAQHVRKQGKELECLLIGGQLHFNSDIIMERVKKMYFDLITAGQIHRRDMEIEPTLRKFIRSVDQYILALDISVFDEAQAPGCNDSGPAGVQAQTLIPLITEMIEIEPPASLQVTGLNPSLDTRNRTSRLAAFCISSILENLFEKGQKRKL
jgi:formiminoglutamase